MAIRNVFKTYKGPTKIFKEKMTDAYKWDKITTQLLRNCETVGSIVWPFYELCLLFLTCNSFYFSSLNCFPVLTVPSAYFICHDPNLNLFYIVVTRKQQKLKKKCHCHWMWGGVWQNGPTFYSTDVLANLWHTLMVVNC